MEKHRQGQVHLLRSHTPKGPPGHPISNKLVIDEKEFAKLRPVVIGDIETGADQEDLVNLEDPEEWTMLHVLRAWPRLRLQLRCRPPRT